ncbi:MAG: 23S rRNA (adenine(2503)-C(2))-methyltransferase RlmN [Proteobacteria bacterium]|nr:23S rRNA (adenine(2503)-C(2))-methyltransferase RlmN [Pseudomonadota bacterium]
MQSIRTTLPDELSAILVDELGEKIFRTAQILRWIFIERVESWDEMTNISKALRSKLAERFELTPLPIPDQHLAKDGTNKIAFKLADDSVVESVLIPTEDRLTLCVSSQVGCKFNCAFCRTATLGFHRSLTADEIIAQVLVAQKAAGERHISNLVFMGMGEPLDNYDNLIRALKILLAPECFDYSRRKITLSSVGHVPGLKALAQEGLGINLAISLHAASDELRSQIMPANRIWGLDELFATLKQFPLDQRQRITFEYIIIKGLNHSPHDANLLVKRLHGIPSKVNLIGFNAFEGCKFQSPSAEEMIEFQERLLSKGLSTTIRLSRGDDELAACGQLGHVGQKAPSSELPGE